MTQESRLRELVADLEKRAQELKKEIEESGISIEFESCDGKKGLLWCRPALIGSIGKLAVRLVRPVYDDDSKVVGVSGTDGVFDAKAMAAFAYHVLNLLLPHGELTCPHCKELMGVQCTSCGHLDGNLAATKPCDCNGCVDSQKETS
jgi:hypothetical protein